jgi:hypothetical protein
MKKSHYGASLFINVLILIFAGFGLFSTIMGSFDAAGFGWCRSDAYSSITDVFRYFGNDASLLLFVASFVMVIADARVIVKNKEMGKFPVILKFAATISVFFVFIISYCVLWPSKAMSTDALFTWKGSLWLRTVCPILAVISLIGFELDPKLRFVVAGAGILPVAVYASAILPLIGSKSITTPYPFLNITTFTLGVSIAWCFGLLAFAYLISILLFLIRKGIRRLTVEKGQKSDSLLAEETEDVASDKNTKILRIVQGKGEASKVNDRPAAQPAPVMEKQTPAPTDVPTGKFDVRVYHVSRHITGKWQVKLATGSRPIKLFDTQDQAIAFAKDLVKSQGGSIRVHSKVGKLRKG